MRVIVLFFYIGFFLGLPVYALNMLVMPQLEALSVQYRAFDATAEQIANAK